MIVKIGADLSSFLSGMKDAVFSMEGVKEAVESLNQSFLGLAGIDLSIRAIREFVAEGGSPGSASYSLPGWR